MYTEDDDTSDEERDDDSSSEIDEVAHIYGAEEDMVFKGQAKGSDFEDEEQSIKGECSSMLNRGPLSRCMVVLPRHQRIDEVL